MITFLFLKEINTFFQDRPLKIDQKRFIMLQNISVSNKINAVLLNFSIHLES